MKKVITGCLLVLAAACPALAGPTIDVGDIELLPGTAGQEVQFYATATVDDLVQGLNFYIQIADGGPEAAAIELASDPGIEGPHITGVDLLTGTIFEGNNDGQYGGTSPLPQLWDANVSTVEGTVVANGLIATVTFDTTEWGPESVGLSWDLKLSGVAEGVLDLYSGFAGPGPPEWAGEIPTEIFNGTITIAAAGPTLSWDGQGNGNWGDIDGGTGQSRWQDAAGSPVAQLPSGATDVVVGSDVVTVAEDRQAAALTINGGTVAIAEGKLLAVESLDLGVGGTLAFGGGAQLAATGDVALSGALALQPAGPLGDYGRKTETVISAAGNVTGTFGSEPAAGEHLGAGVFYDSLSYAANGVDVDLLQAAAGDTDGDADIDNTDLQLILGAGSFNNGTGFDWPQGDFDGDTDVDNSDLQLILATNLFGAGSYAATAGGAGTVGAVPEPSTLVMLGGAALGLLLFWRGRRRAG